MLASSAAPSVGWSSFTTSSPRFSFTTQNYTPIRPELLAAETDVFLAVKAWYITIQQNKGTCRHGWIAFFQNKLSNRGYNAAKPQQAIQASVHGQKWPEKSRRRRFKHKIAPLQPNRQTHRLSKEKKNSRHSIFFLGAAEYPYVCILVSLCCSMCTLYAVCTFTNHGLRWYASLLQSDHETEWSHRAP